jgi:N-carbamoylputrescine amidase
VRDAANQGAEVITLPELYSHYFCQSEDIDNFAFAEPLYSTSFFIGALAKELGVVIIVPFFEKKNGWHLS